MHKYTSWQKGSCGARGGRTSNNDNKNNDDDDDVGNVFSCSHRYSLMHSHMHWRKEIKIENKMYVSYKICILFIAKTYKGKPSFKRY